MHPTSKVIQIVTAASSAALRDTVYKDTYMTVLCKDGSIWDYIAKDTCAKDTWECILEAPKSKKLNNKK